MSEVPDEYKEYKRRAFAPCTMAEAIAKGEAIQEKAARMRVRPQGATAHPGPAKGWKSDAGKPLAGIVLRQFSAALMGVAKVMTLGTTKEGRTEDNWQSVENGYTRYYDAFARHLLKFGVGTMQDYQSKLPHIDHMITNLMIMRHFLVKEGKIE